MLDKLVGSFDVVYKQGQSVLSQVYSNTASPFLDKTPQPSTYAKAAIPDTAQDETDTIPTINGKLKSKSVLNGAFNVFSVYTIGLILVFVFSLVYLGADTIWQKFIFSIVSVTVAQTLVYINR